MTRSEAPDAPGMTASRAVRYAVGMAQRLARGALPRPAYMALRRAYAGTRHGPLPVGTVRFGDLRRTTPLDPEYGYGRGGPVDRYYIERFLAAHAGDVRGRVLEVKDAAYTHRFGGARVTRSEVVDIDPTNPHATRVADLSAWPDAPAAAFDCVLLTQTLQYLYDLRAAMAVLHRVLAPGGVLLVTTPGLSAQERGPPPGVVRGAEDAPWYWLLTAASTARLLGELFGADQVTVAAHGNVLAASAFLYGLGAGELTPAELDVRDPAYDIVVTARAVKADR